jgi:hypothetical protein
MNQLTFLTREELKQLGLSQDDIRIFVAQRVKIGSIDSQDKLKSISAKLSADGAKKFSGFVVVQAPTDKKLNRIRLQLTPNPAILSSKPARLKLRFQRQTEPEEQLEQDVFRFNGLNIYEFSDVSFEHLIHIRIEFETGELLHERVLLAAMETRGELPEIVWQTQPLLHSGERIAFKDTICEARLQIDVQRTRQLPERPKPVDTSFIRKGCFEVVGKPNFMFTGYKLSVALVSIDHLKRLTGLIDTQLGALAAQIHLGADADRFINAAANLPAVPAQLEAGGGFRISQTMANFDGVVGWVWLLSGADFIVGFRPDITPSQPISDALIFLPSGLAGTAFAGLPQDVSEATLLNRPDIFSDDPGSVCKPFSNPGRILGEKRFRTVLRVTQPSVARTLTRVASEDDQGRRPIDFPRQGVSDSNEIDYELDPSKYQARSVAIGHVIEYVVRYRSNGYSLGNVAHSLTLAPRQKRRIMTLDFSATERAMRQEASSGDDSILDSLDSRHDYDSAVEGEFSEWSRGQSSSSAMGGAGGIGAVIPGVPVVIGGGFSGGQSDSAASQEGMRETAVKEQQRLRDSIRRFGESTRNYEATVVKEVEQTESIKGVSEVVQNINYTRALSVVYYEILRHLRVDTEVGSVSECVFVPLPIRPFSDERIRRHRKVLSRFARGWLDKAVFQHLDSILGDFRDGEIPAGARADQPLTRLSGSFTMTIGINMPTIGVFGRRTSNDTDVQLPETEQHFDITQQFENAWQPFAELLPMPVKVVAEMFANAVGSPGKVDSLFRKEIMPAMARAFLGKLTLFAASNQNQEIKIDVTPPTGIQRGKPFQVDFDAQVNGVLTRRNVKRLILNMLTSGQKPMLPLGSYLTLNSSRIDFATKFYEGRAFERRGNRDLLENQIDPPAVVPEASGASITFDLTSEDELNLRERLIEGFTELKKNLASNTFRYHKAIWRAMDPDELYTLLDGFSVSDTDGRSIASLVERKPLGILGNSLVYATRTDRPLDQVFDSYEALRANYVSGLPPADPMRISLPTSGLYAKAHLDDCVAAEEHNGSFDWVFANNEPELADFPAGMFDSRRTEPEGLAPTPLPQTIINLQNAPTAPAPIGMASALTALGNSDAFRDITGLAGTQENLRAAMSNASSLASSAMTQAVAAQAAQLTSDAHAGKDLTAFAAATKKAVERGQISHEAGQQAVEGMALRKGSGGMGGRDEIPEQAIHKLISSASNADGFQFASTNAAGGRVELAVNKTVPKKETEGGDFEKTIIEMGEKAVATSLKTLNNWVSEPEEPFAKVLQEALLEEAKKELKAAGVNLVEEVIPFGGALIACVKLSMAFAEGAGKELIETNKRLQRTYDHKMQLIFRSDEMTNESIEALRELCSYQLTAVIELNGILRAGLEAAFSEAFDQIKDGLFKVISDNEKTIIKHLAKENELLSLLNAGVSDALEDRRSAVSGKILGFFVKAFVSQLAKSRLQDGLKTMLGTVRGSTNVPSELFAGLCMAVLDAGTGALSAKLGANVIDVKRLLLEQAKKLMDANLILPVRASPSGEIEIHPTEVLLPQTLISEINAFSGSFDKPTLEMQSAVDAFNAYKTGQEQLLRYSVGLELARVKRGAPRGQAAESVERDSEQIVFDVVRAFFKLEKVILELARKSNDLRLDDTAFRRKFMHDVLGSLFVFDGWAWGSNQDPFKRPVDIRHYFSRVEEETEL